MTQTPETRKMFATGIFGALVVACCIAGPAVLGAVGGVATGSVLLGAVVALVIASVAYASLRLFMRMSRDC